MSNSKDDPLEGYPLYEDGTLDQYPLYEYDIFDEPNVKTSVLKSVCEESREVVDDQVELIGDIDDKAIRTFRINIVLLGLILTAISIFVRYQAGSKDSTSVGSDPVMSQSVDVFQFINIHTKGGMILLLISIAFAGFTYTYTSVKSGIDTAGIEITFEEGYDEKAFYNRLAEGYHEWIAENSFSIQVNAFLFTCTVLLTLNSVFLIVLGVALPLGTETTIPQITIPIVNYKITESPLVHSGLGFTVILIGLFVVEYLIYKATA